MDFDEWAVTGAPRLLRFAYLVCHDVHLAEDLTQDVLAEAFARWSRMARVHDVDAYLRRSLVNRRSRWWRRIGRHETPLGGITATTRLAPVADDERELWDLCRGLPRAQWVALVLRFHERASYAEIAETLGCAEATARSHVHRGLAALRRELEESDV